MRRSTQIAVLALALILSAAGCASTSSGTAQSTTTSPSAAPRAATTSLDTLVGTWDGWLKGKDTVPVQVTVNPDGTYASRIGSAGGTGTFQVVDGKIVTKGHLSGSAFGADRQSVVSVSERNGRPVIVGDGRSDAGPYSFELLKR